MCISSMRAGTGTEAKPVAFPGSAPHRNGEPLVQAGELCAPALDSSGVRLSRTDETLPLSGSSPQSSFGA